MKIRKEIVIKSIWLQYGNLKAVSKQLNCCRKSLYNWINKDKELQDELFQARETLNDLVESNIRKIILHIDPNKPTYAQASLLIWYLKFYRGWR